MRVALVYAELHIPEARSLKQKRSTVQSVVRSLDRWKGVAASEVSHQERWQRAGFGIAVVGGTVTRVHDVVDAIERHLWSRSDAEVVRFETDWPEHDLGEE